MRNVLRKIIVIFTKYLQKSETVIIDNDMYAC